VPYWLYWFLLGVGLIAFEALVAFTFYAGAIALGAFPAAIVAALGGSVELQVAVFAVGSAFSLLVIRPLAKRHLQTPATIRTGTDALIGAHAVALEPVDADGGQVKIRGGDVWTARSADPGTSFDAGAKLVVKNVRGVAVEVTAVEPDADPPPEPGAPTH
jgi:membrane protein implicated in regulation of membrane protease activity